MGKESNSHYHAHMKCLKIVDSSFSGGCLVIPEDLVPKLSVYQKVYLSTCLQVPAEKVNVNMNNTVANNTQASTT